MESATQNAQTISEKTLREHKLSRNWGSNVEYLTYSREKSARAATTSGIKAFQNGFEKRGE